MIWCCCSLATLSSVFLDEGSFLAQIQGLGNIELIGTQLGLISAWSSFIPYPHPLQCVIIFTLAMAFNYAIRLSAFIPNLSFTLETTSSNSFVGRDQLVVSISSS